MEEGEEESILKELEEMEAQDVLLDLDKHKPRELGKIDTELKFLEQELAELDLYEDSVPTSATSGKVMEEGNKEKEEEEKVEMKV